MSYLMSFEAHKELVSRGAWIIKSSYNLRYKGSFTVVDMETGAEVIPKYQILGNSSIDIVCFLAIAHILMHCQENDVFPDIYCNSTKAFVWYKSGRCTSKIFDKKIASRVKNVESYLRTCLRPGKVKFSEYDGFDHSEI